jgi:bacillithiol system protein YtxJ
MSWFSSSKTLPSSIPWIKSYRVEEIKTLLSQSENPILFFKHSTRCSISAMALERVERQWSFTSDQLIAVYIDVLNNRESSDFLSHHFGVVHQSPQAMLIYAGSCVYQASHNQISLEPIINFLQIKS